MGGPQQDQAQEQIRGKAPVTMRRRAVDHYRELDAVRRFSAPVAGRGKVAGTAVASHAFAESDSTDSPSSDMDASCSEEAASDKGEEAIEQYASDVNSKCHGRVVDIV